MEKNSSVVLTQDEIKQINNNEGPSRLQATWGFTIEELQAILKSGNFTTMAWSISEPGTEGFNL